MKKIAPLIAAVILSSVSTISAAEGFYTFGSVGKSDIDTGISSGQGYSVDETDTMFTVGAGYSFNDFFSFEAGYADLGEASVKTTSSLAGNILGRTITLDGSISADIDGIFFGVKGEMDVANKVSLFAKTGLLNWESNASLPGTVYTVSGSEKLADGTDPYIALGAAYAVTEAVSVDFQVSRYMLDFEGTDVDVDTLSLGVSYYF